MLRQMTCISDMLHSEPEMRHNTRKPEKRRNRRERDRLRTEIAKQVDTWMTSTPVVKNFLLPSNNVDNGYKQQKRYRLGDLTEQTPRDESPNAKPEINSNPSENASPMRKISPERNTHNTSPVNQSKSPETKYNLVTGFRKHYKVSKSRVPAQQEKPRKRKNSTYLFHRSVHDEIEFQKRYRRLFDFNKHLQFVNSNLVSGKNIHHRLPPLANRQTSASGLNFGMFEINSVQKYNDPGELTEEYSEFETDSNASDWLSDNKRTNTPLLDKYKKLPEIPVNESLTNSNCVQNEESNELGRFPKLPDIGEVFSRCPDEKAEQELVVPEREVVGTCGDSGIGDRTLTQTSQASECEPYPEMKISVNIKYKPEVSEDKNESEQITHGDLSKNETSGFDGYYELPKSTQGSNVDKLLTFFPRLKVGETQISNSPVHTSNLRRVSE